MGCALRHCHWVVVLLRVSPDLQPPMLKCSLSNFQSVSNVAAQFVLNDDLAAFQSSLEQQEASRQQSSWQSLDPD